MKGNLKREGGGRGEGREIGEGVELWVKRGQFNNFYSQFKEARGGHPATRFGNQ